MNNQYEDILDSLCTDLDKRTIAKPISFLSNTAFLVLFSLFVLYFGFQGKFRTGILSDFKSFGFVIESLSGGLSIFFLGQSIFKLSRPGEEYSRSLLFSLIFFVLFCVLFGFSIFFPYLPVGSRGGNPMCQLEIFYGALAVQGIFLFLLRKATFISNRVLVPILLTSAFVPIYFMEFACKYDPVHSFHIHIGPAFIGSLVGFPLIFLFYRYKKL